MIELAKALFFLTCITVCLTQDGPQVTVPQGTLRGAYRNTVKGKTFRSFTSIPYAKPPLGQLRFEAPVPADPWKGVLNASRTHPFCPQSPFFEFSNEDCLFLNVYTPKVVKTPLPVMLYIHGGGWIYGNANAGLSGPDILLDKDVVFVTVNYRLGALGFLSMGDRILPGNNGLKDVVLALKWVRNNIRHFGGDPHRITVFGQSSGASTAHYLLLSPLSKDLIFGAIAQSGSSLATWAIGPRNQAVSNAKRLGGYLNCPTNSSQAMKDCLRKIDVLEIINQNPKFMEFGLDPIIPFKPVVEPNIHGAFLTALPTEIIKSGNFAHVPFMSGITTQDGAEEAAIIYNDTNLVQELDVDFVRVVSLIFQYDEHVPNQAQLSKLVREFYFGDKKIDNSTKTEVTDMMTDVWYLAPQNYISILQARCSRAPVYNYVFGYAGPVSYSRFYGDPGHSFGVVHADDLLYLISTDIFPDYIPGDSEKQMNEIMTTLWTNFAKTGNPTPERSQLLPNRWEPLHGHHLKFYYIGSPNNVSMIENPYQHRTQFWKNHPIFTGTVGVKN